MTNQTETTTKKPPTLIVSVDCYEEGRDKPTRYPVGAGWEHSGANGYNFIVNGKKYSVFKAKSIPGETRPENAPTHYIAIPNYKPGQVKPDWFNVGAGWDHEDGNGQDLYMNGFHFIIRHVNAKSV